MQPRSVDSVTRTTPTTLWHDWPDRECHEAIPQPSIVTSAETNKSVRYERCRRAPTSRYVLLRDNERASFWERIGLG